MEGSSMDGALGAPPADDGPLSFAHSTPERLFDILNASLRSSSQVEGAWGGAGTPPLDFEKIEGAGRSCCDDGPSSETNIIKVSDQSRKPALRPDMWPRGSFLG